MADPPYSIDLNFPEAVPSRFDSHVRRTLSAMKGQFFDTAEYDRLLQLQDTEVYEVYGLEHPEVVGDLLCPEFP